MKQRKINTPTILLLAALATSACENTSYGDPDCGFNAICNDIAQQCRDQDLYFDPDSRECKTEDEIQAEWSRQSQENYELYKLNESKFE